MQAWFASLAPRERAVVIGGAALACLIIGWALVWSPLRAGAFELDESVAEKRRLLASLQRAEALGGGASGGPRPAAEQSLVLLVDQTHRSHGLTGALSRNQPDGADGIRVTFQGASFDALVTWLDSLEQGYGIVVETASFDGTQQAGIVSATLLLRRS